jgi:glycerol uptake facilitator-like aquaporin
MVVFPGVNGMGPWGIAEFLVVHIDQSSKIFNAFFMEMFLTFILVYVIFATAFDTVATKDATGVKVVGDKNSGANMTIYVNIF